MDPRVKFPPRSNMLPELLLSHERMAPPTRHIDLSNGHPVETPVSSLQDEQNYDLPLDIKEINTDTYYKSKGESSRWNTKERNRRRFKKKEAKIRKATKPQSFEEDVIDHMLRRRLYTCFSDEDGGLAVARHVARNCTNPSTRAMADALIVMWGTYKERRKIYKRRIRARKRREKRLARNHLLFRARQDLLRQQISDIALTSGIYEAVRASPIETISAARQFFDVENQRHQLGTIYETLVAHNGDFGGLDMEAPNNNQVFDDIDLVPRPRSPDESVSAQYRVNLALQERSAAGDPRSRDHHSRAHGIQVNDLSDEREENRAFDAEMGRDPRGLPLPQQDEDWGEDDLPDLVPRRPEILLQDEDDVPGLVPRSNGIYPQGDEDIEDIPDLIPRDFQTPLGPAWEKLIHPADESIFFDEAVIRPDEEVYESRYKTNMDNVMGELLKLKIPHVVKLPSSPLCGKKPIHIPKLSNRPIFNRTPREAWQAATNILKPKFEDEDSVYWPQFPDTPEPSEPGDTPIVEKLFESIADYKKYVPEQFEDQMDKWTCHLENIVVLSYHLVRSNSYTDIFMAVVSFLKYYTGGKSMFKTLTNLVNDYMDGPPTDKEIDPQAWTGRQVMSKWELFCSNAMFKRVSFLLSVGMSMSVCAIKAIEWSPDRKSVV